MMFMRRCLEERRGIGAGDGGDYGWFLLNMVLMNGWCRIQHLIHRTANEAGRKELLSSP